jgi:hypothetical protein
VPVPPACAGLPDRDTETTAPQPHAFTYGLSGDRRARVSGPSEGRVLACFALCWSLLRLCEPVRTLGRTLTTFPSYVLPEDTPESSVRPPAWERAPLQATTDRPRPTLLRLPAKATGIPWIGVPSTAATATTPRDCSPWVLASASRSRRPHVTPMAGGNVLCSGHCKRRCVGESSPASDQVAD